MPAFDAPREARQERAADHPFIGRRILLQPAAVMTKAASQEVGAPTVSPVDWASLELSDDHHARAGVQLLPESETAVSDRVEAVALDFGGTISATEVDPWLGQKPVDETAVPVLRKLHRIGIKLILVSNTTSRETRWSALKAAQVDDLFHIALLSEPLGKAKPHPSIYRMAIAAADCHPSNVLFVGDHLDNDVITPMEHGMRGCLVRPDGLLPEETTRLPNAAMVIRHVAALPELLTPPTVSGTDQ